MCSQFWTLVASYTCPHCQRSVDETELQTHYQGEAGSCMNVYRLGEPVAELADHPDVNACDMDGDAFCEECPHCDTEVEFRAELRGGAIVRIWPVSEVTA